MRNLKKTMCLVLALVFVLGLCTVGAAGTTFSDEEAIEPSYLSAVKAMNGLGIVVGYPDGTFLPKKNVSRAEAAKIISYVVVGPEVEKWPAKQVFDDVPADHWAAKYVTFCEYNKIIAGYGNGKFGPDDPVTQAQLSRMLLSACGYGAKDEFLGEGWDQNVAAMAFQTKVLKGIKNTDWDAPASREETALLAYNCMMNTKRVTLSEDRDSYVALYVNGVDNVTFAQTPWNLVFAKGIVTANKANSKGATGTYIWTSTTYNSTTNTYSYGTILVQTENDEDAALLGHEVTVMYRQETINNKRVNVAYYLNDECEEVDGNTANTAEFGDQYCSVLNGYVDPGVFEGAAKNVRYKDTTGIYVLNAEGELVAYKEPDTFRLFPISIDPVTKIATIKLSKTLSVEVTAPEGAVNGDMMTLYQCGNVYTVKPCTKVEKVAIKQKQLNDWTAYLMGAWYSYNDGEIQPSDALNLADYDTSTINAFRITTWDQTDADVKAYEPDLEVGWTYTLFFDAEGGCFAYSDGVPTYQGAGDYALFITGYHTTDAYGDERIFAQYVAADGSIGTVQLVAAWELTAKGEVPKGAVGVSDEDGSIYAVGSDAKAVPVNTVVAVTRNALIPVNDPAKALKTVYNPADPTFDYANANFISHTGAKGTLVAKTSLTPDLGKNVDITFRTVKIGTTWIKQIDTVWFDEADAAAAKSVDSYIYVVNTDIREIRDINETNVYFYNGFKDGVAMTDLTLYGGGAPTTGFFTYKQVAGAYILVPAAGGRDLTLKDANDPAKTNNDCYFYDGKLWVPDDAGVVHGIDMKDVKIVASNATLNLFYKLGSVADLQSLLLNKNPKYTIEISFVQCIDTVAGVSVYSAGGNVIYVNAVNAATAK